MHMQAEAPAIRDRCHGHFFLNFQPNELAARAEVVLFNVEESAVKPRDTPAARLPYVVSKGRARRPSLHTEHQGETASDRHNYSPSGTARLWL